MKKIKATKTLKATKMLEAKIATKAIKEVKTMNAIKIGIATKALKAKKLSALVLSVAILVSLAISCSQEVTEKDAQKSATTLEASSPKPSATGVYFGQKSIALSAGGSLTPRTILPSESSSYIESNFSAITLSKKKSGEATYTPITTYATYSAIKKEPTLIALDSGTYSFKVALKLNKVDYSQELTNVTIGTTPVTLHFSDVKPVDTSAKGSMRVSLEIYKNSFPTVNKAFAKLDGATEEEITLTPDSTTQPTRLSGGYNKALSKGQHTLVILLKADTTTVLTYPTEAFIYAGLESRKTIAFEVSTSNNFIITNITYNDNKNSTAVIKSNEGTKLKDFADLNFTEPAGQKFIAWNTQSDGLGKNYYKDDTPAFKESKTLYAQYLPYDTSAGYKISTATQLLLFFNSKIANAKSVKATLQKDLSITDWVSKDLAATLDGANKSLTLTANTGKSINAFIDSLSGAIKNLEIANSIFSGAGKAAAFALSATDGAVITNCKSTNNTITASATSGAAAAIVATTESSTTSEGGVTITNCQVSGNAISAKTAGSISTTSILGGDGNTKATLITQTTNGYTATNAAEGSNPATTNTFTTSRLIEQAYYSTPKYKTFSGGTTLTALIMALEANSKITCKVTITEGDAIYGGITNSEVNYDVKDKPIVTVTESGVLAKTDHLTSGSSTLTVSQLPKKNYYIRLYNDSRTSDHTGTYLVTIE